MNSIYWWRKAIPTAFCILFLIIFLIIDAYLKKSGFWLQFKDMSPAYTFVCEHQNLESAIRQPLNTLSNFLLLFFGIEIMVFALRDRKYYKESRNMVRMNYQYSLGFGISLVMLFLGSTFYHASMLDVFSQLDMVGVYACILFPMVITIHKIIAAQFFGNRPYFSYLGSSIAITAFLVGVFILAGYFWQDEAYYTIPLMVISLYALSFYYVYYYTSKYRKDFLLMSIGSIAIAFLCYSLDWYYCAKLSYFQFHSVWHIMAAFSLYYFYLFLRTEHNLIMDDKR